MTFPEGIRMWMEQSPGCWCAMAWMAVQMRLNWGSDVSVHVISRMRTDGQRRCAGMGGGGNRSAGRPTVADGDDAPGAAAVGACVHVVAVSGDGDAREFAHGMSLVVAWTS